MRGVAALAAALATVAAPVLPAGAAEPVTQYGPWTASTSAIAGNVTLDATCVFGPMIVGEPPQLYVTGVATAPGALSTTIRCEVAGEATVPGSAAALHRRVLWDSPGGLCVSASATFLTGTVTAPTVCVDR